MSNKVGPGAMSHYGLREKPVTPSSTAGAGGGTGGPSDVDGRGVHEGVNGPRGEAGEEARGESEEMGQVEHEGIHL